MARCKACGASIVWIATQAGKNMPCDAELFIYWEDKKGKHTIITPNGETVRANIEGDMRLATGIGYIPHWATCPQASNFKKRGNDNGGK